MENITTLKIEPSQLVSISNSSVTTTSLKIAEAFGKRHDDVLKAISRLNCSDEFYARNFAVCFKNNELQNGKPQKYYQITKDGFYFLVMGFTGKKAAAWKEAFINAFNAMEAQIKKNALPNNEKVRDQLNKAVKTLVSVLNKNGNSLSYSDAWRLVHLKSGMDSVEAATQPQLQNALNLTITLIEKNLYPAIEKDTNLPKLLRNTVTKITLIEQIENQLNQAIDQLTQFKNQISKTRYSTTDLKLYLNLTAKELETKND